MTIAIILIILVIYAMVVLGFRIRDPELHWDWRHIDQHDLTFPKNFVWGTATAAHQIEGGCHNNNWHEWEQSKNKNGESPILKGAVSGEACDHWNRYEADIELMKQLGVKSYRFSVEWSKIEPENGQFDETALQHYSNIINAIIRAGVEPVLTLYHFTHPIWFKELGAFEKSENIAIFQRFCERVFNEFSDRVPRWCTINEIEVEATQSYFSGIWPPGKKDPALVGEVIKNLLEAHVRVYQSLKKQPNGDKVQIGLVKNIFQFDPYRSWHLIDNILALVMDTVFNSAILRFLKTGRFRILIPGLLNVSHSNPKAPVSNDFIGLNYYSHFTIKPRWKPSELFEFKIRGNETPTDMEYSIYPEGFYRAIMRINQLGLPIFITENGIADKGDHRRGDFIRQYLYALSRAIGDGAMVKGYYYWSLMDNFEWAEGYEMKFGLYEVDFETQERKLRKGSQVYQEIINR